METTEVRAPTVAINAIAVGAMATAALATVSMGVLGPYLLPAFDISRSQLGLVVTTSSVLSGIISPFAGRIADRLGARHAIAAVFGLNAAAFVTFAVAPTYAVLVAGAAIAASSAAGANPATNKLIAGRLPEGRRGMAMGLKQAGFHLGSIVGGASLPFIAAALGWRVALGFVAAAGACAVPITLAVLTADDTTSPVTSTPTAGRLRIARDLGVFGFLLGLTNSATLFLPLFAVEELGVSATAAGATVGLMGAAGIVGRVGWARAVEASGRFGAALQTVALGGVVGYALVLLAAHGGGWPALAIGALVVGGTSSSGTVVAMLTVMSRVGAANAGRASGLVMVGFFFGFGVGPPLQGLVVDRSGRYDTVWLASMAAGAAAWAVARRTSRVRPTAP